MGDTVSLVVGDFTATIGDPTGRDKTRPVLSRAQARENAETFLSQANLVLDKSKVEVSFNSSWLDDMPLVQILQHFTIAQMLERDEFKKRFENGVPITMAELTYPLMQGWDSVILEPDVELGGTDQTFNMNIGRDLMRLWSKKPQEVWTVPILTGTDGVKKMSKSLNNHISVREAPHSMFTKIIGIPDELGPEWARLLSDVAIDWGDPIAAKKTLAKSIIARLHGSLVAESASVAPSVAVLEPIKVAKLVSPLMGVSLSEVRRLIKGGGITLNGEKLADDIVLTPDMHGLLRAGRQFFITINGG